jgi:hypothetical protein
MPRFVRSLALFAAALAPAALAVSCTSMNQATIDSYSKRLAPIMNQGSKEAVALEFGVPTDKQIAGKVEIWEYLKETGAVADAGPVVRRDRGPVHAERTFEKLTLEFDEHAILRAWRLENESGVLWREPPPEEK